MAMVTSYENNQGLVERYWVSSEGVYLFVDPTTPLFIDSNTETNPNQLCFVSKDEAPYYELETLFLRFTCTINLIVGC